jgi:hypothetical protein
MAAGICGGGDVCAAWRAEHAICTGTSSALPRWGWVLPARDGVIPVGLPGLRLHASVKGWERKAHDTNWFQLSQGRCVGGLGCQSSRRRGKKQGGLPTGLGMTKDGMLGWTNELM